MAIESAPPDKLDERFEILLGRIARLPINQLIMQKLMVNQTLLAAGLQPAQTLAVVFDGIGR
ncbi:MAG: enoyl-CoA hydratase, partial [Deltaproteobacteria bacterium]|nr:enoyl-CoA hydratase [Deltaproteobacteria bacterium]